MNNYTSDARTLDVAAPSAVTSGVPFLSGSLVMVPIATAASGAQVAVIVRGRCALPKAATITPALGVKLYWDNTAGNVTSTSTSNTFIGYCVTVPAAGDATIDTYLHGCPQ